MSISRIPPRGAAVAGTQRRIQFGIPRPNMIKPSAPIERSATAKQIRGWCNAKNLTDYEASVILWLIQDLGLE